MRVGLTIFLFAALTGGAIAAPTDYTAPTEGLDEKLAGLSRPLAPEEALASIHVGEGMRVELAVAEPLVMDPIDVAWGVDGRMWVVEMADYPLGCEGGGRVRFLEDEDGDGRYDKSTLFADGLNFPTGVMPWREGVLVTAAPEILYLEDRDGDGTAETRKVLYRGFEEGNQQHRVNGLQWGLDNWIHIANGDSGGEIESIVTGVRVDISGRDLRIQPERGLIETETGRTQYGRNRDDWGNWFGCSNSRPMWHFVLADRYLRRNPHLATGGVIRELQERAAVVFPVSETMARFNQPESANRFTSACGAMIYRDGFLGESFSGNSFVAEPVHNLVHREVLAKEGVSFVSGRAPGEEASEFFASDDHWSRPVAVRTGPDGALWIVDMYRLVIEHPQWIPDDWEKRIDLRAGAERGRIYRVLPEGKRGRPMRRLDELDAAGLVAVLRSSNGWERDAAHQLLLWRGGQSAVPELRRLAREGAEPLGRVHALCALEGLGALDDGLVTAATKDESGGVRRQAVRLSEGFAEEGAGALVAALAGLAEDPDPFVRLQLANTLGEFWRNVGTAEVAAGALWTLWAGADDAAIEAAVMSSAFHHRDDLVEIVLREKVSSERADSLAERLLVMAVRLQMDEAIVGLMGRLLDAGADDRRKQFLAVGGFLEVLGKEQMSLKVLQAKGSAEAGKMAARADAVVARAREVLRDASAPEEERVAAAGLLGRGLGEFAADLESMAGILDPRTSVALQLAVVESLGRLGRKEALACFVEGWSGYGPAVRMAVLRRIVSRRAWTDLFLDEMEAHPELLANLGAVERQAFLQHPTMAVADRAEEVFGVRADGSREAVVAAYAVALEMEGDVARGKGFFAVACGACHRLGEVGREIGPDLTALTDKSKEALLIAILDPNRAVEEKFVESVAMTMDGRTLAGIVTAEAGNSITMLGMDGVPQTILRNELKSLTSTGRSLMPEGLEAAFDAQAVADVCAYVSGSDAPEPD